MKGGIYPVDRHATPIEKLLPAKVFYRPETNKPSSTDQANPDSQMTPV